MIDDDGDLRIGLIAFVLANVVGLCAVAFGFFSAWTEEGDFSFPAAFFGVNLLICFALIKKGAGIGGFVGAEDWGGDSWDGGGGD